MRVTTHDQLKSALATLLARTTYDAIFMTAAVADYNIEPAYFDRAGKVVQSTTAIRVG